MNNIQTIKLDENYVVIPQKPYLCCMACLSMVTYRREKILFEQEEMAKYFKVKVHPDLKNCFNTELDFTEKVNDDEWLQTIKEEELTNKFFKEKKLNLKAKAWYYSDIPDLKLFIEKNLKDWNDMWVEYKTEWIFPWSKWIHDWLIESIDWSVITMIDPGPRNKNRYQVHLDYIEEALSDKFARETGIVVIKGK